MNLTGLAIGLLTLITIGTGFYWVIKLEYHVGAHIWKSILVLGITLSLGSLLVPLFWMSALLGIMGGSIGWGATELPEQAERVRRGIYPDNPKKKHKEAMK